MDGKKLQIRAGHIPGEYYYFTTPTIRYAALDCYTHTYDFRSPVNGRRYKIRVALQCKQKPDSFTIQPETVGATKRKEIICPHISNDQMEWKTDQRSAIMPYALLLCMVDESGIVERSISALCDGKVREGHTEKHVERDEGTSRLPDRAGLNINKDLPNTDRGYFHSTLIRQ